MPWLWGTWHFVTGFVELVLEVKRMRLSNMNWWWNQYLNPDLSPPRIHLSLPTEPQGARGIRAELARESIHDMRVSGQDPLHGELPTEGMLPANSQVAPTLRLPLRLCRQNCTHPHNLIHQMLPKGLLQNQQGKKSVPQPLLLQEEITFN